MCRTGPRYGGTTHATRQGSLESDNILTSFSPLRCAHKGEKPFVMEIFQRVHSRHPVKASSSRVAFSCGLFQVLSLLVPCRPSCSSPTLAGLKHGPAGAARSTLSESSCDVLRSCCLSTECRAVLHQSGFFADLATQVRCGASGGEAGPMKAEEVYLCPVTPINPAFDPGSIDFVCPRVRRLRGGRPWHPAPPTSPLPFPFPFPFPPVKRRHFGQEPVTVGGSSRLSDRRCAANLARLPVP